MSTDSFESHCAPWHTEMGIPKLLVGFNSQVLKESVTFITFQTINIHTDVYEKFLIYIHSNGSTTELPIFNFRSILEMQILAIYFTKNTFNFEMLYVSIKKQQKH
jgi:hypothetical protein